MLLRRQEPRQGPRAGCGGMTNARNTRCCLCGAVRRPTQAPVEAFGNGVESIPIYKLRPIQDGAWEAHPSLLVSVSMWRNGGTASGETHICDDCVVLGLEA